LRRHRILIISQAMPTRRPSLLYRFRHYIHGPNPLHPAVWEGRLSPLTFRRFQISDLPECLEIYKLNEPGRFPEGVLDQYERRLREQSSYFLVAERNGHIIAAGGIAYSQKPHWVMLSFGLVRPDEQGKGVGTALLLARLALLKNNEPVYRVLICAVAKSLGFYERFGFRRIGTWKDLHGVEHPIGSLVIHYAEAQACCKLLTDHGISVPPDEAEVPFRRMEKEERSGESS
jgi:N-acetylglutamate synthase-like GNAT family acetyltransferase